MCVFNKRRITNCIYVVYDLLDHEKKDIDKMKNR